MGTEIADPAIFNNEEQIKKRIILIKKKVGYKMKNIFQDFHILVSKVNHCCVVISDSLNYFSLFSFHKKFEIFEIRILKSVFLLK